MGSANNLITSARLMRCSQGATQGLGTKESKFKLEKTPIRSSYPKVFCIEVVQACNFTIAQTCSVKRLFLKISHCARVSFLIKLQALACNFIKKETLAQVFSCEFCENFENNFFYRTPPAIASIPFQSNILPIPMGCPV